MSPCENQVVIGQNSLFVTIFKRYVPDFRQTIIVPTKLTSKHGPGLFQCFADLFLNGPVKANLPYFVCLTLVNFN